MVAQVDTGLVEKGLVEGQVEVERVEAAGEGLEVGGEGSGMLPGIVAVRAGVGVASRGAARDCRLRIADWRLKRRKHGGVQRLVRKSHSLIVV